MKAVASNDQTESIEMMHIVSQLHFTGFGVVSPIEA